MTQNIEFARTPHPSVASEQDRAAILMDPGYGHYFTDHMVSVQFAPQVGWHSATVEPYAPIRFEPSAMVLHYAQSVFEGLKVYRQPDGRISAFRPGANSERFQKSAARLAMPPLPTEIFQRSLEEIMALDHDWVPEADSELALYLRPFMFATDAGLGVKPSSTYRYLLIASPVGAYFPRGVRPVSVWLSYEYVRATPGGTGTAKCAGNYAASLLAQAQAADEGCDQVVWLDAVERRYVEEMGGMNLFFVFGSGTERRLVTPALSGSLLPGITRDSILTLATDLGIPTEERPITVEEWQQSAASGELTEVFACGTAAVITPVGEVKSRAGRFTIADGEPGQLTSTLRSILTGIQRGTVADQHNWMTTLRNAHPPLALHEGNRAVPRRTTHG